MMLHRAPRARVSFAVFIADADETLLAGIVVGELEQIVFAVGEVALSQFYCKSKS